LSGDRLEPLLFEAALPVPCFQASSQSVSLSSITLVAKDAHLRVVLHHFWTLDGAAEVPSLLAFPEEAVVSLEGNIVGNNTQSDVIQL
jgi:hypothetical protein